MCYLSRIGNAVHDDHDYQSSDYHLDDHNDLRLQYDDDRHDPGTRLRWRMHVVSVANW